MKKVEIPLEGLSIYDGREAAGAASLPRCCYRCGKEIEGREDDRGDADTAVCFWCAVVDPQG